MTHQGTIPFGRTFVSDGNLTLDQFTDTIHDLLELVRDDVTFIQHESSGNDPESVTLPVITHDVFQRVRSDSHRNLKPIKFEQFRDPEHPATMVELFRMWFDVELEFKFYHETNRATNLLMQEFEDFLFTYEGEFQRRGISDLIFLAEVSPTAVTRWGRTLTERCLRYLVRIERITQIRSNTLSDLNTVSVDVDEAGPDSQKAKFSKENPLIRAYGDMHRKL